MYGMKRVEEDVLLRFNGAADASRAFLFFLD